uniref:Uncharacterized protein n=1 Tax=Globisporangium ultimum (strain ATCC 200006 / CBS 805.95 / DAOM BR144) TaxID=431595 RepID=K3X2Q9_GLOUD
MARTSRFDHGNRWHAISRSKWKLVEVLKVVGAAVLVLLFCWNLSMLSTIVQPSGHEVHSLRSSQENDAHADVVEPSALNTAAEVAETKDDDRVVHDEKKRPWFLNPEEYERETGCDFSAAVQALRPEQLAINCENIEELKLEEFLGEGYWREVYRANWKDCTTFVYVV